MPVPMDEVRVDLSGDLNAAFQRLLNSGSVPDEERRALRDALACLYELREHRIQSASDYFDSTKTSRAGRVTEGIVWLRGRKTHAASARPEPRGVPLYPGDSVYPSEFLFPGANL
jgi:hypothetical protein